MYVGIGRGFMTVNSTKHPRFYIKHGSWYYMPSDINTTTEELFRLSWGIAGETLAFGMHGALGQVKPTNLFKANGDKLGNGITLGFGMEASYHFWKNIFIKGSVTYFLGASSIEGYEFVSKGTVGLGPRPRLEYNKKDIIRIGSAWTFGAAIGYRFNL